MSALRNKFLNDPNHPDSDILPHLMKLERANVLWSQEEHDKMLEAALKYGKDYSKISEFVGTKTRSQCQAYRYRFVKILDEDAENDWKELIDNHLEGLSSKPRNFSGDSWGPSV